MSYLKASFCVVLLFFVGACSWQPHTDESEVIRKPQTDQREFRYLELDNGLKVLLVSDPGADKAAASLDVNVGSRQDPADYQGLAHFLEHMLFLGTQKYPEAGEYQRFISAHGGGHNAFTSFEHTNYFFDISADSLAPALDRFSQFFIAPLFNAEFVQREVNAVNSEYRARIRDDRRRELAVFKSQINKAHPFSKFSVGNLKTLKSQEPKALREQLLAFYRAHYSANLMTLTVIGKESLAELEDIVVPRFASVANHERENQPIEEPLFETGTLPRWLNIEPIQNRRALSITFPVPDPKPYWRSKPLNYIANILGHEGEGSLLSILKAKGWAESLSSGQSLEFQGGALFGIEITLTEKGLAHSDEIIALLFENIRLLREQGVEAWRFTEQAKLAKQQFLFRAQPAAISEVVQLSSALQDYPAREVIRGNYLMADFEPAIIDRFLDALRPENSFIIQVAPGVKTAKAVARYQVKYSAKAVDQQRLAQWQTPPASALALPAANPFVADDFDLVKGNGKAAPTSLGKVSGVEVWLQTDDRFELPKGRVYLLLQTPTAAGNAAQHAKTELWLRMVKDQLNELVYPAQLAGLGFGLSVDWRGIEVSMSGFDQKQPELLQAVLQALVNTDWEQGRFDRIKAQRLRQFENARKGSPYEQAVSELPRALQHDEPALRLQTARTQEARLKGVADHASAVLSGLQLRLLAEGNFSESDAKKLAAVAASQVPVQVSSRPLEKIVVVPQGESSWEIETRHDDAAVLLYVQSGSRGATARVSMGLAAQIMSADFYYKLRTEKQLGYVVNAGVYPQREVPGMIFLVQSPVAGPKLLQKEMQAYIKTWLAEGVSREEFDKHKATLLKRLAEQPENLWEAADRHWRDLLEGYTEFDSREQLAAALSQLDYEAWWSRLQRDLSPSVARQLYIYNRGKWADQKLAGEVISSLGEFKTAQEHAQFE